MRHPDEDTLLARALDLLEGEEEERVVAHVSLCPSCAGRLEELERDTAMLGELEADIPIPRVDMPARRSLRLARALRIAAVLAVGFVSGYGISFLLRPVDVTVMPSSRSATTPAHAAGQFTSCESLDLSIR